MKRTKLIVIDDEFGVTGLVIAGINTSMGGLAAASEGLLIAHDIVEHQNGAKEIGTIDDELEALGGIWHARGRHGDTNRGRRAVSMYSPEESIAADVSRMFVDFCNGAYMNEKAPRTREHDQDESFNTIIEIAEKGARSEAAYSDISSGEISRKWAIYVPIALARMRIGYRKCTKRFGNGFGSNNQFWAIAEAVEPYMKGREEGEEFTLLWGNGDARIVEPFSSEY